jgi:hypothetical protein
MHAVPQGLGFGRPVDPAVEVGHRFQDIQGRAAVRGIVESSSDGMVTSRDGLGISLSSWRASKDALQSLLCCRSALQSDS